MTKHLQMFIEYKVKKEKINEYERAMESVMEKLPEYEASEIEWFVATDQPYLYVEMFKVPTISHYHALKKLRQLEEHQVFGCILPYIEGGANKLHCWAFERKE